jgi:hypothetical protein
MDPLSQRIFCRRKGACLNFSPAVAGFVSLNGDVEAEQGEVPWARQQLEPFSLELYLPDNVMDVQGGTTNWADALPASIFSK